MACQSRRLVYEKYIKTYILLRDTRNTKTLFIIPSCMTLLLDFSSVVTQKINNFSAVVSQK